MDDITKKNNVCAVDKECEVFLEGGVKVKADRYCTIVPHIVDEIAARSLAPNIDRVRIFLSDNGNEK